MSHLKLVAGHVANPKELAFEANELYVYIASRLTESEFKENMLHHLSQEREALIKQVAIMFQGIETDAK